MMKRGLLFTGCLAALLMQLAGCDSKGGQVAILDIDPKVGATQGEQYVKILGKNFRQDIGYTVYFGTKKSGQVTIVDPETLLAVTPTGAKVGAVDVLIRADDGNAFRIPQGFKFEEMGGSVVEGIGAGGVKKSDRGNLAY
ncbi:MAG TPA: IPT/TIG domain-containing protein [Polyangiales bacterium]|nr:IPT/TIG domain-containing protein [Polyangiales bacterium]